VGFLQLMAEQTNRPLPLDILTALSIGMIGYLIDQELQSVLPPTEHVATILSMIEVDRGDPAFTRPTKPIGPTYESSDVEKLKASHGWAMIKDGSKWRRAVASPQPRSILQLPVIRELLMQGTTVICAGGGGIPVTRENARLTGQDAVIDKDLTSARLAIDLNADALILLTDVDGIYRDWNGQRQDIIKELALKDLSSHAFETGSMAPKVEAAAAFMRHGGMRAAIGQVAAALDILDGRAGTNIIC
jgi:carbamate kinase